MSVVIPRFLRTIFGTAKCNACGRRFYAGFYCNDNCFDTERIRGTKGQIYCPECLIRVKPVVISADGWSSSRLAHISDLPNGFPDCSTPRLSNHADGAAARRAWKCIEDAAKKYINKLNKRQCSMECSAYRHGRAYIISDRLILI